MTTMSVPRFSPARLRWSLLLLGSALAFAACGDKSPTDNGNKPPVDSTVAEPAVEARVLWLSRYDYSTRAGLVALIDSAAKANFNIIYFQARGNGDALYTPGLEPWYRSLTSPATLGANPGWDPLQTAIDRAHGYGIELHAWMNVTPAWSTAYTLTESTPRHMLLVHPEWAYKDTTGTRAVNDGSSMLFSPGAAGYRTHVARVAADVVRRYNVDGIHLDYIRYPYGDPSYYDKASWDAWIAAGKPGIFDDFRRAAVSDIVKQVHDSMQAVRPAARLSAATWGVYKANSVTVSWSPNPATGYEARLQDPKDWADKGIIDAVAPMVYWKITPTYAQRLDFAYLTDEHLKTITNRHVYIGLDIENDSTGAMMIRQIKRTRVAKAPGVAVFSAQLLQNLHLWHLLYEQVFTKKATVPTMSWK